MKFLALIVFCAFALQASLAQAAVCDPNAVPKPICVNQPCAAGKLGAAVMDSDKKYVIACLVDGAGMTWKPMVANDIPACPAGQALVSISNGTRTCGTIGIINQTCPSGYATNVTNGVMNCGVAVPSCSSCCPACPPAGVCGMIHVCGTPKKSGSWYGGICTGPGTVNIGGGGPSGCL
ncbi:MAG: hypothetical protein WC521_08280 [Bdellovibrionales bacterium]